MVEWVILKFSEKQKRVKHLGEVPLSVLFIRGIHFGGKMTW